MSERETFTTTDLMKVLEVPKQRLREWLHFLPADIQQASGYGTKNLFSRDLVYGYGLFKLLITQAGFKRELAGDFVKRFLADDRQANAGKIHFIYDETTSEGIVVRILETGSLYLGDWDFNYRLIGKDEDFDYMLIVNYERIKARIDKALG